MSTRTAITKYTYQQLSNDQQQEIQTYLAFYEKLIAFQNAATQQSFLDIFGEAGTHIWRMFLERTDKDVVTLVYQNFITDDQKTQLFHFFVTDTFLPLPIGKLQNNAEQWKLNRRYSFIAEIIRFGVSVKVGTLEFLFGDESEKLWTTLRKDCGRNIVQFVFGDYLSSEQRLDLLANILAHTTKSNFQHFQYSSDDLLNISWI